MSFYHEPKRNRITVGDPGSDYQGFDADAIDRAAAYCRSRGGGSIKLSPGIYHIDHAVRLGSHVRLIGSGEDTILRKTDGAKAVAVCDADYNQRRICLDAVEGFAVGMDIQIYEKERAEAWDVTTAQITDIRGNQLFCDSYLERDYKKGAIVAGSCACLSAIEAEDIYIGDLVIDGNGENNEFLNGCRGGGIYFYKARDCIVEHVKVKNFNGDGISWQTTQNICIRECEVAGCRNFGVHPGAGSKFSEVEGCQIHHNGQTGIYICWRVKKGFFENNEISYNGLYGISIGHKDTDNVIRKNRIHDNKGYGIYFRPEEDENASHRNIVAHNIFFRNGNCGAVEGDTGQEICIDNAAQELIIYENLF